ncbi:MAG: hypothetical protein AB4062_02060 [Crocosphaera sp.]
MAQEKRETPNDKRLKGLTEKAHEKAEEIKSAIDGVGNPLMKFAESAKNSPRRVLAAVAIGASLFVFGFLASPGDKIENKLPVAGGAGIAGTSLALTVLPRSKREQKSLEREEESLEFAEKRSRYKQFREDNQEEFERIQRQIEWAKEKNPELVDLLSEEYRNLCQERREIRNSFNNPQTSRQPSRETPSTWTPPQLEPDKREPMQNLQERTQSPQPEPVKTEATSTSPQREIGSGQGELMKHLENTKPSPQPEPVELEQRFPEKEKIN